ncbi:MAG: glycosyltransferase family 9 protein [Chitinophagaceae bacterium]|nr:glycosyltransferase family 9 protein [Oligoflexus sp.]
MPQKILLVQLRQLGDIILTTPSLREMKKLWPDATIDFLCHPMGKLILQDNPYVNSILTYDLDASWMEQLRFVQNLRARGYDLVLDFMYNPRSAFYSRATGAPKRLAFPSRRAFLYTDIVPQNPEVEYIVREKFRYLEYLGLKPTDLTLDLPWDETHLKAIKQLIETHVHFRDAPVRAVISCTHRREERQWPVERYAEIADRLVREKNATVVWIWGPGEEDFVKHAMTHCKEPMLLSPATAFRELAAILANCDFFIGNSNGPSHVAVANSGSSLQLHGTTYARGWCPDNERHRSIQAGAGMPGGLGPINLIPSADVWHALDVMWPVVIKVAAKRRMSGMKLNWTQRDRND